MEYLVCSNVSLLSQMSLAVNHCRIIYKNREVSPIMAICDISCGFKSYIRVISGRGHKKESICKKVCEENEKANGDKALGWSN